MSGWLVVNQSIELTDRTRQQVNSRGLACETAHNWQTAEQRLLGNRYDVIVVDQAVETGDSRDLYQHLADSSERLAGRVIVTGDEPVHAGGEDLGVLRCEARMLADIDDLIRQVGH
ncbi:hypothetical protein CA51_42720 [Rosistilla oblonga]|uniref:Response regulatory domain-containing protein n=1 Tax=Rosistilla oblonga TaxID=2527990 RepID=A0A518IWN2_9BACT|nr:hypothetical protein [Rosistilla oblonga]QDV14373.1 hypothetical protein CA51_42720 [Rosistilla oblonga]QDV57487.1 hypothetical protein Mal33_34970 [Rosistilla oblonga]